MSTKNESIQAPEKNEETKVNNSQNPSVSASEVILKVSGLVKRYEDLTVLDRVDLSVRKGEVVVIVGPSGCGKSTFLRCLNGLENIQEGRITLDGETIDSTGAKLNKVRERIGMVFQSYELFPHKTVLQNMTLAPVKVRGVSKKDAEAEALQLLERVGLLSKKDQYPSRLSGG
ncbi:MAG: ATP-binding cassette domain-containing protein, partial [Lachnospiraceae bacterium]|nr:ATP-binding cassette domain-containing protein [Lachnospiraceae bacterium]